MSCKEWEEVRLGDIVESISVKHKFDTDKIILINTSDVLDGKVLNHTYVDNRNIKGQFKKSFQKGDILYSEIRPQNRRFAYIDFDSKDYVASTKLMVLRKSSEKVETDFLFQILKSDDVINMLQTLAETRSGTFPQITYSELANIKVLLPSLVEQKNIAHILSTLDEKIEVNNQINKKLEEMAQAIFKHWFIDFEFPNEDGEPYKSSGGEMVESELGMIPKGWEVGTVNDLGEVVGGSTPSKKREDYFTNKGIPWITPKDLSENKDIFISRGSIDITEEGFKKANLKKMPKGTVLFSSRAPIGYIAISKNEVTTNQGFKSIVPDEERGFSSVFIYCWLKENLDTIKNRASGSTFKEISGGEMKKIPAIIPNKEVLDNFSKLQYNLISQIECNESQNRILKNIRAIILPKLMSGEIRVPLDN